MLRLHIQREEELLSNWWKEYGECSVGPKGSLSSIPESDPQSYDLPSSQSSKLYTDEEERVGVPVKGGLYEVYFLTLLVYHISSLVQDYTFTWFLYFLVVCYYCR